MRFLLAALLWLSVFGCGHAQMMQSIVNAKASGSAPALTISCPPTGSISSTISCSGTYTGTAPSSITSAVWQAPLSGSVTPPSVTFAGGNWGPANFPTPAAGGTGKLLVTTNLSTTALSANVVIGYIGPGDIITGQDVAWTSCSRAYSAAYAAAGGNACVVRAYTGTNAGTTKVINVLANGLFDTATANAWAGVDVSSITCTSSGNSLICTGASSTPNVGDTFTGAGVTQPCFALAVGTFTGGAGTVTTGGTGCGTIGSGVTMVAQGALTIQSLFDQTGDGNHPDQNTTSNQPLFLPKCLNSGTVSCLYFDSDFLFSTTGPGPLTQPFSRSFVANRLKNTSAFNLVVDDPTTSTGFGSSPNTIYAGCGSNVLEAATDGVTHSVQSVCNGTSSIIYLDGTSFTVNAGTASTTTGIAIGATAAGTAPFGGYFEEGGEWSGAVSGAHQTALCNNQNVAYGLAQTCL